MILFISDCLSDWIIISFGFSPIKANSGSEYCFKSFLSEVIKSKLFFNLKFKELDKILFLEISDKFDPEDK